VGRRRLIDLDDDLYVAEQAAAHLGISLNSFFAYVERYAPDLDPAISRGRYIRLWIRQDLDAFKKRHPGVGSRPRDASTPPS
jgi:hypothetical protein